MTHGRRDVALAVLQTCSQYNGRKTTKRKQTAEPQQAKQTKRKTINQVPGTTNQEQPRQKPKPTKQTTPVEVPGTTNQEQPRQKPKPTKQTTPVEVPGTTNQEQPRQKPKPTKQTTPVEVPGTTNQEQPRQKPKPTKQTTPVEVPGTTNQEQPRQKPKPTKQTTPVEVPGTTNQEQPKQKPKPTKQTTPVEVPGTTNQEQPRQKPKPTNRDTNQTTDDKEVETVWKTSSDLKVEFKKGDFIAVGMSKSTFDIAQVESAEKEKGHLKVNITYFKQNGETLTTWMRFSKPLKQKIFANTIVYRLEGTESFKEKKEQIAKILKHVFM
ncbi:uncharacterized protein [Amphiura filiformis]|uniref:uncharacterized protein n=1 Tax=Amphiura filiformis TaxID=82378 RepID=UPI003B22433E